MCKAQWQLDDEAAAALARLTALCLGWDAVGAMAAECKEVTPAFFADVREVRRCFICGVLSMSLYVSMGQGVGQSNPVH